MNELKKGIGYLDKKLQLCIVRERAIYSIHSLNLYTKKEYSFAENGRYIKNNILSDGKLHTVPEKCKNKEIGYLTNLFVLCFINCSINGKSKSFLHSASEEQTSRIHIDLLHKKLSRFKNST